MTRPLSILYANVIRQHAGWGFEWFMDEALRGHGHQTWCVDYRLQRGRVGRVVAAEAPRADAFLLQRGDWFPLYVVRAMPVPRVFLATELALRQKDQHRLFRSAAFEHLFVRTPACIDVIVSRRWADRGRISILLSAFSPKVFHPLSTTRDIDVLFVGTITPRRRRMLDALRRRFAVQEAAAFGADMNLLFNRARIVLNLHAEDRPDTEVRVYEALGSGAFLLSERLSEECPFDARHLVQVNGEAALAEAVEHYLGAEGEREAIAAAGHAEALRAHTFAVRAEQIVAKMRELGAGQPGRLPRGVRVTPAYRAACGLEPMLWRGRQVGTFLSDLCRNGGRRLGRLLRPGRGGA